MSEQVLVSRDALEMLLRNHTVFGDYPQNYDTFCASCGRPKPFANSPGTHEHTCPVPSLVASLTPPAPAQADTWEAVNAVAKEANTLPPGVELSDLPRREDKARFDLIESARAYRHVLRVSAQIPECREKYHRDLAEFRAALNPEAPP